MIKIKNMLSQLKKEFKINYNCKKTKSGYCYLKVDGKNRKNIFIGIDGYSIVDEKDDILNLYNADFQLEYFVKTKNDKYFLSFGTYNSFKKYLKSINK